MHRQTIRASIDLFVHGGLLIEDPAVFGGRPTAGSQMLDGRLGLVSGRSSRRSRLGSATAEVAVSLKLLMEERIPTVNFTFATH